MRSAITITMTGPRDRRLDPSLILPSNLSFWDGGVMTRQGVRLVLAIYFAIGALYGLFHLLATPGSGDWDWPSLVRNILGWTLGPLILGGFLPALFWGFGNFRAEKAGGPLLWCGIFAALLALAAGAQGVFEGSLSLRTIPENVSGLFSSEQRKFVRVVRNACDENLREHPVAGTNLQQSAAFCLCYANALADVLSARELGAALTSQNAMSPELRRKVLLAAPACRKQAFGCD